MIVVHIMVRNIIVVFYSFFEQIDIQIRDDHRAGLPCPALPCSRGRVAKPIFALPCKIAGQGRVQGRVQVEVFIPYKFKHYFISNKKTAFFEVLRETAYQTT